MDRNELIIRLLEAPDRIRRAELEYVEAADTAQAAERNLRQEEAEHINAGMLSGSNEQARKAQLFALTAVARAVVESAERDVQYARLSLTTFQNEFAALRAVARLLAAGTE